MSFNVFVNGKEYKSLQAVGGRITYLKDRVSLRPEQQEELDYLHYALSTAVSTPILTIKSFIRWRFPGYDRRIETDLNEWGYAIRRLGKRWTVLCMVKDEVHYRIGVYKSRIEAEEVLTQQTAFLEAAQQGGREKAAFVLSQPG